MIPPGSIVLLLRTMATKPHNPLQALVSLVSISAMAMPVALAQSSLPPPTSLPPPKEGEGDGPSPSRSAPAVDLQPLPDSQGSSATTVIRPSPSAESRARPLVKTTLPTVQPPLVAPPQLPTSPIHQPPTTARQKRLLPGSERKQPAPPPSFDRSLDALVRDRVVLPSERVRVRGNLVLPKNSAVRRQACSHGALTAQECSSGVVFLGRGRRDGKGSVPLSGLERSGVNSTASTVAPGRRFGIDATPLPPISVPVSALLSGAAGNFRLTDVFRVTPRPGPVSGNGNSKLLFPLIGSAITTSDFGWRIHPVIGSWLRFLHRFNQT